jgi:predicted house-cleaning NTP pyrophosphatase (Maf/HAM1 superfamily)
VRSITGSCSNVIGLPINTCISLLLRHNVIAPLQEIK